MVTDVWTGCYRDGWKGLITPASFEHPAKMARGLVFRIIEHALECGMIAHGGTVLDCFGGVGTTGLPSMLNGLNYVGIELEEKFFTQGQQNIEMWQRKYAGMPKFSGNAVLLHGDSRHLCRLASEAGIVVGSPPFTGVEPTNDDNFRYKGKKLGSTGDHYGSTPGQLGAMPEGKLIVSSPPFTQSIGSDDPDKRGGLFRDEKRRNDVNLTGSCGDTPGQLGAMPAGRLVVSSPPFEDNNACNDPKYKQDRQTNGGPLYSDYGSTDGQLGQEAGPTFWESAAAIMAQCAKLLPSDSWAIWVVKSFVRKHQIVDFPGQWAQLREANGFEVVHEHRAMLTRNSNISQMGVDGESVSKEQKRASFFRLLAERKGTPKIDWETVLCTRRY